MSEWKPGDVAVRRVHVDGHEERTYVAFGQCPEFHPTAPHWHHESGGWDSLVDRGRTTYRPLVVIDPEDAEQVERLARSYQNNTAAALPVGMLADRLATALRGMTPTPKPEEPTGLGAVIEDADGQRWVRATNFTTVRHWRGCDEHWQGRRRYDEINAVKVLNEGVQP